MNDKFEENPYLSSTVLKSIDVLNLIGKRDMTATEISTELGINKTTVHRLLYTLEYAGFIERAGDGRGYRLGIKLVELCSVRLNDIELKTEAKPLLMDLVEKIRQPVHLGIYESGKAVFIDKIDISSSMRIYSAIGKSIPIHCSAIGKALVLDRSDKDILDIVNRYGMHTYTQNTIQDPRILLEELHIARENGYTVDDGEHEENVHCLAAPIYDYRKHIIASISTAAYRITEEEKLNLISLLKDTANRISVRLGYIPG